MRVLAREIPFLDPLRACAALRDLPGLAFLDSARSDPRLGRWSYVAADPFIVLSSKDGRIRLSTMPTEGEGTEPEERSFTGDPFAVLQRLLRGCPLETDPELPPFQTGAVGYLGYDLAHHLERLPSPELDDLRFPDLLLGFY